MVNSRDPFQMAQAMYQSQQPNSGLAASAPAQPATSNQPTISSLYNQPEQGSQGPDGVGSDVNALLQAQGIDTQGLQWNDMGRMQLQSRLQSRFGTGYDNMPDAQKILQAFDRQRMQMSSSDQNADDSLAKGQRTLAFLQGIGP